jgi:hypothetical protein
LNRSSAIGISFLFAGAALMLVNNRKEILSVLNDTNQQQNLVINDTQFFPTLDSFGEPEPSGSLLNFYDYSVYEYMNTNVQESGHQMQHFSPSEFREWWEFMDVDLLIKLDLFREMWGKPIMISPVDGSLGREAGESLSYHNVTRYGQVRAVDIFPSGLTTNNAGLAVSMAEKVGFGGIGLYTDTKPSMMMHLDNRSGSARWARVNKKYVGIDNAIS